MDYYEILEVRVDATKDEIRTQYRFLIHAWHPDKFPEVRQKEKAEARIKKINEAYAVLGDPDKRSAYDRRSNQGRFHEPRREGGPGVLFHLTLHPTYYNNGFFNVPIAYDRFVRSSEGPVDLLLGGVKSIRGTINRRANTNGTARIFGGNELKQWFLERHRPMDTIEIDLGSFDRILIG